jgi:hypothetical protein
VHVAAEQLVEKVFDNCLDRRVPKSAHRRIYKKSKGKTKAKGKQRENKETKKLKSNEKDISKEFLHKATKNG